MHKYLKLLLIGFFTLSETLLSTRLVIAQYDADYPYPQSDSRGDFAVDVEPPLIEHDIVDQAEADIRQTFVASVVDDQELDSVLLFYRFAGESSYSRYVMMRVSFSSSFVAQIPTNPSDLTPIEYYIQARDTSGNRTVRGYNFSPLVRQIVPVIPDAQIAANHSSANSGSGISGSELPGSTSTGPKVHKAVYVVAGVLLLGLIASAAGSSSGSSTPSPGGDCGAGGCRLTLTVNRPY